MMEDDTIASSSAHDVRMNRKQTRKRVGEIAYSLPGQEAPKFTICNQYGPSLEPALVPLARTLVVFDMQLFRRVYAVDRKHASSANEAQKAESASRIEHFIALKRQWKDVESNKHQFSLSYMQGNDFVPIWVEGLRIVREALGSNKIPDDQGQKRSDFMRILEEYDNRACRLEEKMLDATRQGILSRETFYSIQERWIRLDEILDWYYDRHNRDRDEDTPFMRRRSSAWSEVRRLLEENGLRTISAKEPIETRHGGGATNAVQHNAKTGLIKDNVDSAFILWLALFACVLTSVVSFALGYAHSSHLRGTTRDADFWFLIQSAIMQLLGLVVTALLEWRSGNLPKTRWAFPAAVAGISSILAIPLYLVIPTEWSSFLSIIAGGTQSFMALQHFLVQRCG